MNVDIRYRPTFATLFVTLNPGESIVAEADAMTSMSSDIRIKTRLNGGFFAALLKRFLGGESMFVNEFYCDADAGRPGELVLSQGSPGDIQQIDLRSDSLFLQPGAYLASAPGVKLSLGWAGFASWIGGEGLFRLKVKGEGAVWFGGYGGVFEREVDEEYIVDTGHLLAYEPTIRLKAALSGGIFASIFGGEGLVTRVRGPGKIYLQSRSMDGLAAWTNSQLW